MGTLTRSSLCGMCLYSSLFMMGQTWDRLTYNRGLDNTIGEERNSSK